jgi:hypothetical protein
MFISERKRAASAAEINNNTVKGTDHEESSKSDS